MDEVIMMIHRDNWPAQYHTSVHPSCYYCTTLNFCDQIFHYLLKKLSKVTPKDFNKAMEKFGMCACVCVCVCVCARVRACMGVCGAWSSWGLLINESLSCRVLRMFCLFLSQHQTVHNILVSVIV